MKIKKYTLILSFLIGFSLLSSSFTIKRYLTPFSNEYKTLNEEIDSLKTSVAVSELWVKDSPNSINCVKISANGSKIALSNNTILEFYDSSNITPLWTFNTMNNIRQIEMSDDGRYILIMVRTDIYLFDSTQPTPEQPVWSLNNADWFEHIAISADGSRVAAMTTGSNDTLFLLNKINNNSIWTCHLGNTVNTLYRCLDISDNGEYISIMLENGTLCLFNDTASSSKTPIWIFDTNLMGLSAKLSADGSSIVAIAGSWSGPRIGKLFLFNNTLTSPKTPVWIFETFFPFDSVFISADGNYIAAGRGTNSTLFPTLFLFNAASNVPLWQYTENEQYFGFMDLAFTTDGKYLVTGTELITSIFLFDTIASDSKDYLWYEAGEATSLDMSHDGRYLVVARGSNTPPHNVTLYELDYEAPDVSIVSPSEGIYGPSSLLINASITDVSITGTTPVKAMINSSTPFNLTMTKDSEDYWTCTWDNVDQYTSGPYKITIWAIDDYNQINASEYVIIWVDVDGPTVLIDYPSPDTSWDPSQVQSIEISVYISDAILVKAMINATTPFNLTMTEGASSYWTCLWSNLDQYTGYYNITVWAVDNHGNVNQTQFIVIYVGSPPNGGGGGPGGLFIPGFDITFLFSFAFAMLAFIIKKRHNSSS